MDRSKMKRVLCPVKNKKTDKTHWINAGIAFLNRDGSTNILLDVLPMNGSLQLRDFDEKRNTDNQDRVPYGKNTQRDELPF